MKSRALIVVLLSLTLLCLGATTLVNLAFQVTGILPAANFTVATTCPTCVVASSPGVGIAHFAGSTQTVTSSAVNLAGADVTGVLPVANGGVANLTTANSGYFFGCNGYQLGAVGAGIITTATTQVRACQFVLPHAVAVRQLAVEITTNAGTVLDIGLYDSLGTTLLLHNSFNPSTTGVKTASISGVALNPGVYWFAWSSDNTSIQTHTFVTTATISNLMNATTGTIGTSSATATAGALPSTLLGTMTGNNTPVPVVKFGP